MVVIVGVTYRYEERQPSVRRNRTRLRDTLHNSTNTNQIEIAYH